MATIEVIGTKSAEPANQANNGRVPRLNAGDHLTRQEFERRYSVMPETTKAELVEGVVFMPSPVSHQEHSRPHSIISVWLGAYWLATPGTDLGTTPTVRLDLENEPQPDSLLRILPKCGGRSRDEDTYIAGPPELVVEVSASSVSYDLHEKLRAYQRNGVREYIVWRVWDSAIDWFVLREGQFGRLSPDTAGILKSEVFSGLWLDPTAPVRGDLARVMAVVHEGIASPEHAKFVAELQARGA